MSSPPDQPFNPYSVPEVKQSTYVGSSGNQANAMLLESARRGFGMVFYGWLTLIAGFILMTLVIMGLAMAASASGNFDENDPTFGMGILPTILFSLVMLAGQGLIIRGHFLCRENAERFAGDGTISKTIISDIILMVCWGISLCISLYQGLFQPIQALVVGNGILNFIFLVVWTVGFFCFLSYTRKAADFIGSIQQVNRAKTQTTLWAVLMVVYFVLILGFVGLLVSTGSLQFDDELGQNAEEGFAFVMLMGFGCGMLLWCIGALVATIMFMILMNSMSTKIAEVQVHGATS